MGTEYWQKLGTFLHDTMLEIGTISPEDLKLWYVTDDPADGTAYIKNHIKTNAAE